MLKNPPVSNSSSAESHISTEAVHTRYHQANALVQGIMTNRVVRNDGVFPHWLGDSQCFWYQRETTTGKAFHLVDANQQSNTIAFDHAALARALAGAMECEIDPDDLPITLVGMQLAEEATDQCGSDASARVLVVEFCAFNTHWQFDRQSGQCHSLAAPAPTPIGLSPDGRTQAFVRDHNLWLRDIASGEERLLTKDGSSDFHYATAPSCADVQVLWSPDGRYLLTHQLDLRHVTTRPMVDHVPQDGGLKTSLQQIKMSYPGDKHIESYRLLTIEVASGEQTTVADKLRLWKFGNGLFSEEKLSWWHPDSQRVYFVDLARGSKTVRVMEFDTRTGETRVLIEETTNTFVKLAHNDALPELKVLPDTNELIWFSERSGWAHLYLYDLDSGRLKHAITEGKWLVRHILHIDIERRELIVHTGGRDSAVNPHYRDVCRIAIDSGEITDIAVGNYEHSVFGARHGRQAGARAALGVDTAGAEGISPNGRYIVTTRSRVDTLPESILCNSDGETLLTLETAEAHGLPEDWVWPEPVQTKAADGKTDIYGVVYRPPGCNVAGGDGEHYPVLDFSNGKTGFTMVPQGSFINGPCIDYPYYYAAAFAALGFVVVVLEGRGMPNRDKAFHDYSHGFMASACALEDRVAGIRQLAERYPYMDTTRVGIVAGDGFSSPVYGLLEYPDFYRVGVSIAFEDGRLLNAPQTECFEGYCEDGQAPAVTERHAEYQAANLTGKLLLIHGLVDMFVPQSGTFRLVHAFQEANKDVDLVIMPQDGHDIPAYALRRTWDYLVTHLRGETPPEQFVLKTGLNLLMDT